ncbi:MAG: catalytic domain of component of various dehydrogenase complexe [Solirubrobacterales bacterium]|jgi:pyruvate dehydrogenase E2 component (dihydrolipoamide acetyltransferase)|nr:catalytic domain of component of various dehydrogenase complexe [Solirubrobacterales bacterium]
MAEIVMPRLSDSMEEGTVIKWLKSVGDEVAVGDELVEIETDKANMVYEADSAGTLTEIVAEEGATMPIGETIARVGDAGDVSANGGGTTATEDAKDDKVADVSSENGEAAPGPVSTSSESPSAQPSSAPEATTPSAPPAAAPAGDGADGGGRVKASPIARRIARDKGVDLHALAGSGPGGRIIKVDVERAAIAAGDGVGAGPAAAEPAPPTPGASERPETAKGQTEVVELSKLQQTVARRMAESKATAPHFYLETEIDMSAAFRARKRLKEMADEGEPVPTFNDMVVKACALALRDFPRANGAYRDGRIELYSRVNVGVAVAAQDALVVPTVFDADRKGLRQIAAETRALAQRVREGQITPPELSGGTFTVSNLGMYGVSNFGAVINTPQAGILAVGELKPKAVVRDGEIVSRELMGVTLACDHRILYGADGAQFLARVRALLEEPIGLAL